MKKTIIICMVLALVISFSACGKPNAAENLVNDDNFVIAVTNSSDVIFCGIGISYSVGGTAVGSGVSMNANGSAVEKGDMFATEYLKDDMPLGCDLTLTFSLLTENGEEIAIPDTVTLNAEFGNIYYYTLRGGDADSLRIEAAK